MDKTASMILRIQVSEDEVHDFIGHEVTVIPHTTEERAALVEAMEVLKATAEQLDNPTLMVGLSVIFTFFGRAKVTSHGGAE